MQRGAFAIVGASTRTYSGSGSAFTLAFFDAVLYERQTLGSSLRHAKNFLLAYSLLKEKRLGADARLGGANVRSAWAFSLWGDPSLTLPPVAPPADALPAVRHRVTANNTIVLSLPPSAYEKVTNGKYQAQMLPNARLAGLLTKENAEHEQRFVPFVFAEVHLPRVPTDRPLRLESRVPDSHYVFCWDARRSTGYLLITPRSRDEKELRFRVRWDE
jgi:hypothetical protein